MGKKYILGAGLSGLVFRLYNPDYELVSEDIGGLYRESPFSGVIVLHDSGETRSLLRDLKLPLVKGDIRLAFIRDGQVLPMTEMTEDERYFACLKKVVSHVTVGAESFDRPRLVSTDFCTGTEYMEILQVNNLELLERIKERLDFRQGKVLGIDTGSFTLGHRENIIPFEEVVSTLPAPTFWKLYKGKGVEVPEIKSLPVTVVETVYSPPDLDFSPVGRTDNLTIFAPELCLPYVRICRLNGKTYYEFTGKVSPEEIRQVLQTPNYEVMVSETGRILDNFNNFPPPSVRFLGRFATWSHKDCIEDVVATALRKYSFEAMIARQASFNAHFYDFNSMTPEQRQRETKEFVLDCISELNSILEAINWKRHRGGQSKPLDLQKLKEEIIDSLKFVFCICNVWGFSAREIVEEFFRKSAIVETRYHVEHKED